MGAPTLHERRLSELLCQRFPGIEQIRFCNSGTEANIWAMTTARMLTGRTRFLAFEGAYHGGVIKFPNGPCALNLPFDFVLADYNDTHGAEETIHRHAGKRRMVAFHRAVEELARAQRLTPAREIALQLPLFVGAPFIRRL